MSSDTTPDTGARIVQPLMVLASEFEAMQAERDAERARAERGEWVLCDVRDALMMIDAHGWDGTIQSIQAVLDAVVPSNIAAAPPQPSAVVLTSEELAVLTDALSLLRQADDLPRDVFATIRAKLGQS